MGSAKMPEECFETVAHHLPTEQPVRPKGGGPVSVTGSSTGSSGSSSPPAPAERTCRRNSDAPAGRRTDASGPGGKPASGIVCTPPGWPRSGERAKLDPDTVIVGVTVRAFGGGEATGPSPVDRRKKGTTHTPMVDRHGIPLVIRTARANASDHRQILTIVLDFHWVRVTPGKPKRLPADLYDNCGHNSEVTRALLRWLRIEPHIVKRRRAHGSELGRVRWEVKRTISWLKGLPRIRVQYDRLGRLWTPGRHLPPV
jgi:hypothetical protein